VQGVDIDAIHRKRGKRNRQRGQEAERELCALIEADLGITTKRLLGQERDRGHDINLGPLRIEVKRRKRVGNLYDWLQGADAVAIRGDGQEWLVTLPWPLFARLVREEVK
jgi:hypothetical protein